MKPPRGAAFRRPRSAHCNTWGASNGPPKPPALVAPGEPGALLDTLGTSAPPQPCTALGAAILSQWFNQVSQPGEVIEPIDEGLEPRHPGWTEHQARQFPEF